MEDVPATAGKSRRGPWVLVAVFVVVAALGVGGFLYWLSYTRSPQYSVAMLGKAIAAHDYDEFQKYVDVDAVINKVVDDAMAESLKKDSSGMGALAASLVQSMKPALVAQFKTSLQTSVESKGSTSFSGMSKLSITKVTDAGDFAFVTVSTGQKSGDIKLKLKRVGDFWRVVEFSNLGQLVQAANTTPASSAEANTATLKVDALNARQVVDGLKKAGLPLGKVEFYTAETDPNKLLGRPGNYVEKANWADKRADQIGGDMVGGSVEVFASQDDLSRRKTYLDGFAKSGGIFSMYVYTAKNVLLHIDGALSPKQAAGYERALKAL